ncbi:hypothetical protein BZM27_51890, partial [Paraburkholderia steynii]
ASYEVDFWGFNAANASAADLLARASGFDRDTVALTLTASVADTYFQVQSLRRRLAIARSISDDAAHILQLLLAQQEAGLATELQVQQQRNALATFQAAVPALQQQLDTNIMRLRCWRAPRLNSSPSATPRSPTSRFPNRARICPPASWKRAPTSVRKKPSCSRRIKASARRARPFCRTSC